MIGIECRDLTIRAGGKTLIDDISLAFSPGELTGLVGPNGAGKSTLLRVLAGYRTPDQGLVAWDGRDLGRWSAAERGAHGGYLPQHVEPAWDYSVREIVALGAGRATSRADPLDAILAEHNLVSLAERRWRQLSGGERSRAMLAAIMATRPSIILADEPGASLDIRHRLDLVARLKRLARDAVVIVVMHDLDLAARFCDRLVLLDGGRAIADEAAATLVARSEFEGTFGVRFQRETLRQDRDWLIGLA